MMSRTASISRRIARSFIISGISSCSGCRREPVLRQALRDIQTGEYAKSFIVENVAGAPTLQSRRRLNAEHQIEVVGEKLRAMMPWIKANKLVDKSKN